MSTTDQGKYRVTVDIDVTATSFGKAQNYVQTVLGRGWNAIKADEEKAALEEQDKVAFLQQFPNVDYFETTNIQRLDVGNR